jgi:ABC-type uncharacterized transport system YnjBCD permease subunit
MHLIAVFMLALAGIFLLLFPAIGFLLALLTNYFKRETPSHKTTLL